MPTLPRTIDEFLALGRPRVIAHRGWSAVAPENTIAAFDRAVALGVDMIELDVTVTRDEAVVVIHDDTLDRTTDGHGPVMERGLDELRRLDAGSWFGAEFAGERLPTLIEVLERFGDQVLWNVEIKPEAVGLESFDIVVESLRIIAASGLTRQVMLSSFSQSALMTAKRAAPQVARGVLIEDGGAVDAASVLARVGGASLNLGTDQVDAGTIAVARRAGAVVLVYTVNGLDEARRLVAAGADGVFTDRPDVVWPLTDLAGPRDRGG